MAKMIHANEQKNYQIKTINSQLNNLMKDMLPRSGDNLIQKKT
jgi:hypothetical protein